MDNNFDKKDKQLDNLINLVERHTRTERHLEQYSDIGDPRFKEMAEDKQRVREEQIESLKGKLIGENDKISADEHFENLAENYENSAGYVKNNGDNMNKQDLENIYKKQANRREQMQNLSDSDKKDELF